METQRNNCARGYSLFSANHSAEDQLAIIAELGSIAPEALSLSEIVMLSRAMLKATQDKQASATDQKRI